MMVPFDMAEASVARAVQWLKLGVETMGAFVIALGILVGIYQFARTMLGGRRPADFTAIRLVLARYLALALEFQLGADILSTAIAPGWQEIGKLGAVAVIRTALNFFLSKEMREERETTAGERHVQADAARSGSG